MGIPLVTMSAGFLTSQQNKVSLSVQDTACVHEMTSPAARTCWTIPGISAMISYSHISEGHVTSKSQRQHAVNVPTCRREQTVMIRPSTSNARASTQAVGPAHALGFIRFLVSGRPTAPRYAACHHTRGVTTCGRPWGPGQGSGQREALLALPRMLLPSAQQGFQLRGARALREEAVGGPPEPRPDHQQSSPSPSKQPVGLGKKKSG